MADLLPVLLDIEVAHIHGAHGSLFGSHSQGSFDIADHFVLEGLVTEAAHVTCQLRSTKRKSRTCDEHSTNGTEHVIKQKSYVEVEGPFETMNPKETTGIPLVFCQKNHGVTEKVGKMQPAKIKHMYSRSVDLCSIVAAFPTLHIPKKRNVFLVAVNPRNCTLFGVGQLRQPWNWIQGALVGQLGNLGNLRFESLRGVPWLEFIPRSNPFWKGVFSLWTVAKLDQIVVSNQCPKCILQ